jgi:AcrR family transcriptional regulator
MLCSPVPARPKTPPAKPERKLRADAARNRARVLESARELFGRGGETVEIDDVARSAGVGVGTVYRHFATKEALLHAVVSGHVDRLIEDARSKAKAPEPGVAFFEFVTSFVSEAAAKKNVIDAMSRDGLPTPLRNGAAIDALRRTFRSTVSLLLSRAQRAGAVRKDIDVVGLIAVLRGTLAALELREATPAQRRVIFDVMCDGLRRR